MPKFDALRASRFLTIGVRGSVTIVLTHTQYVMEFEAFFHQHEWHRATKQGIRHLETMLIFSVVTRSEPGAIILNV